MEDKKTNQKLDKLIETQEEFISSVNKFLRVPNNNSSNNRDRFLVKKNSTDELLKNENEKLDKLLKINSEMLGETKKKRGGLFGDLLKWGAVGGLLGWLLFGKKDNFLKGLTDLFSANSVGGLLKGFMTGDWTDFKNQMKKVGDDFGDGLLGQIFRGENKPLNFNFGLLETGGGLLSGVLFGNWDLFMKGLKDMKNNFTTSSLGEMGLIGGLLFGGPILKAALSSLFKVGAAGVAGSVGTAGVVGTAGAIGAGVVGAAGIATSGYFAYKMLKDQADAKKSKEDLNSKQSNTGLAKWKAKGYSETEAASIVDINSNILKLTDNLNYQNKDNATALKDKAAIEALIKQRYDIISKHAKMQGNNDGQIENGISKWFPTVESISKQYPNVPQNLVKAILEQENAQGNPNAEGKMTKYGTAKGLGQFIDSTAKDFIPGWKSTEDSFNPEKSIAGTFAYMDYLLKVNNGDKAKAVGRYFGVGNDPVLNKTSSEYSNEVMSKYEKYNAQDVTNGNIDQNNTISQNTKDTKFDVFNILKNLDPGWSKQNMDYLAKKIAEENKINVTTVTTKQTVTTAGRG